MVLNYQPWLCKLHVSVWSKHKYFIFGISALKILSSDRVLIALFQRASWINVYSETFVTSGKLITALWKHDECLDTISFYISSCFILYDNFVRHSFYVITGRTLFFHYKSLRRKTYHTYKYCVGWFDLNVKHYLRLKCIFSSNYCWKSFVCLICRINSWVDEFEFYFRFYF